MKIAYIIHGWDGSPKEPLLLSLKAAFAKKGYAVITPTMPDPATPKVELWVEKLQETVQSGEDAVLVAHSIGCQAALRFLEGMPNGSGVGNLILIAPWMKLDDSIFEKEGEEVREIARPWMETPIDFDKVKSHVIHVAAIFSDNDTYSTPSQMEFFKEKLGPEILVEHDKGHFTEKDGVTELPSAVDAVREIEHEEGDRKR
jgi:hypothetical protein